MWETTLEVTRKAVIEAAPEAVWALLTDCAAWALRPGQFAFDISQTTGAERLRCWLVPVGRGFGAQVLEVREEGPGRALSLFSRGTEPAGRQAFVLAAEPRGRGTEAALTVRVVVPRETKADHQAFWRRDLRAWLEALAAVAEGRQAPPESGLPPAIGQACAALPRLASPQGTSAGALIGASPELVWQAVRAPGIPADPAGRYTAIAAGLIPGAGELRYVVLRHAGGPLTASVSQVRELDEGRLVLGQRLEPPHYETRYQLRPEGTGTWLELTLCWPDAPVTDEGEQLRGRLVAELEQAALAYLAALDPAGAGQMEPKTG
jgi:uncharacterized protein YndB with AHSA1/START domain